MAAPSFRRVALITGAAQGLGRCIALRLAKDGLNIALNDTPSKREQLEELASGIQQKLDRQTIVVPADVSSEIDVRKMTESVVGQLGGLDVMVANAGIFASGSLFNTSTDEFDRVMRTNVRGVMLCYKYAGLQMIQQGRGGRIIGASSTAGKQGLVNTAAYSASKFAIRGLTQSTALELAKHNITVNAYAPGVMDTTMALMDKDRERGLPLGTSFGEALGVPTSLLVSTPGDPEVIASLVSYLVKPEANFISGQTINVDGGKVFD